MTKVLASGLAGAIGSHYLPVKNQLLFVEYGGYISKIDRVRPLAGIVSQGTATIKGTWIFDCESGTIGGTGTTGDIWWNQQTTVVRQMVPQGTAQIVNLGVVDFNAVTPTTLQTYAYSATPIVGNNDASNKLVVGDVFCVKTREGNFAKLQVVTYGYDLVVKWVTYKLAAAYARIGNGYIEPEDIAITTNETTAYVTERNGNFLRCALTAANRSSATVVASGMVAPHQIFLDEAYKRAFVIEFAPAGRIWRIELATGAKTVIASGFKNAVGLILNKTLNYAYISEQGTSSIVRLDLQTGARLTIATGLTNPFMLSWADASETRLLVPERDPANRISLVDVTRTASNVTPFITGTPARPSSVAVIGNSGNYDVFCDSQVNEYALSLSLPAGGFFYKGIGYVPYDLITPAGKADTTSRPPYPFQFKKDSPFGGSLPVMIDHRRAWDAGRVYYRVLVDGVPRKDSWNDLVMNPANGRYDIVEPQLPDANGYYKVHDPAKVYYNTDLGCLLDSLDLSNTLHQLRVEFYNAAFAVVNAGETGSNALHISNEKCVASLDMPTIEIAPGTVNSADPACGYLKYTAGTNKVNLRWLASHPQGFATYSFGVIKGANGFHSEGGEIAPATVKVSTFTKTVTDMLGTCPGVAAFAESLSVNTIVINGISLKNQYDAIKTIAFCLAK
jgi:hypothetical protein